MFPEHGVGQVEGVVLTHSHNDAAYGLDDLRDLTRQRQQLGLPPLPIYIRESDVPVLRGAFPYLWSGKDLVLPAPSSSSSSVVVAPGGGVPDVVFHLLPADQQTIRLGPLELTVLPVRHGGEAGCWGFRAGGLAYISDAVAIPESTRALLHGCDVLILDALRWGPEHPSHFTIEQACREAERLVPPPRRLVLVGMNHEVDHQAADAFLRRRLPMMRAQLGFDGMVIDLPYAH